MLKHQWFFKEQDFIKYRPPPPPPHTQYQQKTANTFIVVSHDDMHAKLMSIIYNYLVS